MNKNERVIHDDGTMRAIVAPWEKSALQERADVSAQVFIETIRKMNEAVRNNEFEQFPHDGREVS